MANVLAAADHHPNRDYPVDGSKRQPDDDFGPMARWVSVLRAFQKLAAGIV